MVALSEATAVFIEQKRHMCIREGFCRRIEQIAQVFLLRCTFQQVNASYDLCDTLREIVDYNRELVRVDAIGAPDDEIAAFCGKVLRVWALDSISDG